MVGERAATARRNGLTRRVLHVRSSRTIAGPERHLLELIPCLHGRGVAVEVALLYRRPKGAGQWHPLLAELRARGITAWQIDDSDRTGSAAKLGLIRSIRKGAFSAIHGHDPKANWAIYRATRTRHLPRLATVHLHTCETLRLRFHRQVDRWLLRRADGVVAVSRAIAEELSGASRLPPVVIVNGIDTEALSIRARQQVEGARAALAVGGRVLLAAGRLQRQKGFDLLLRALAEIHRGGKEVRVAIAGEGSEGPALRALAERLGVARAVLWLGEREDLPGLLAAADGVVLPSRREGLPYVLLEAMALGRPIVAASAGGIPEALEHRSEGWLVSPESISELAEGLVWLCESTQEAAECGARARRRVREEFSADSMALRLSAFYGEVLQ